MSESEGYGFTYYGRTPTGVEMALRLDVDHNTTPAELAKRLKEIDAELKAAGFLRSDRLDKPQYGRPGNARPEDPAPADLKVPEHCGEPMRYRPKYTNKNGKDVNARFECRKGRQCQDVLTGKSEYPAAEWEDQIRARMASEAQRAERVAAHDAAVAEHNANLTPYMRVVNFLNDSKKWADQERRQHMLQAFDAQFPRTLARPSGQLMLGDNVKRQADAMWAWIRASFADVIREAA